jgi:hypothetical protein
MEEVELVDEAIDLLEDPNLVWSADFELIRFHLWAFLKNENKYQNPCQASVDLAQILVSKEFEG